MQDTSCAGPILGYRYGIDGSTGCARPHPVRELHQHPSLSPLPPVLPIPRQQHPRPNLPSLLEHQNHRRPSLLLPLQHLLDPLANPQPLHPKIPVPNLPLPRPPILPIPHPLLHHPSQHHLHSTMPHNPNPIPHQPNLSNLHQSV